MGESVLVAAAAQIISIGSHERFRDMAFTAKTKTDTRTRCKMQDALPLHPATAALAWPPGRAEVSNLLCSQHYLAGRRISF